MMASTPLPTPDPPALPRVRLDVRSASGRTASYEVGGEEFLIGSASGCDLRLPAPELPPVIGQVLRHADGVRFRHLSPLAKVALNRTPLSTSSLSPLHSGDVLAVAGYEITVAIQHAGLLVPRFISLDDEPAASPAPAVRHDLAAEERKLDERRKTLEAEEAARKAGWQRKEEELARKAHDIERQTEDLESDRVIWYRRRQELEREMNAREAARGDAEARRAELDARERELKRLAEELTGVREKFLVEFGQKREELARQLESSRETEARIQADRQDFTSEQQIRRAELDREIESRRRELDTEAATQRERLAEEAGELDHQRDVLVTERDILEKARQTFESGRAAEAERLGAWEKALTDRETRLLEREEQVQAGQLAIERGRAQIVDDRGRLDRRTSAVEEQERQASIRTREVDVRLEQLKRDAAEWEATLRLATAEQERLRAESERLDRQKAELDGQSSVLAERAGQLEAQQAVLAVLRAKLDRTRQEAEREAAQLATARVREDESLAELRGRIREAEELRAELATVRENAAEEQKRLDERDSLLSVGLAEIRTQQENLSAEAARLQQREAELDVRAAEFAEQVGTLKGRMVQALDLQARLEADRVAVREREAALAQAEEARQTLQEQLRRRAEDLASRARALDDMARQIAAERAAVDQAQAGIAAERLTSADELADRRRQVEDRAAEVARQAAEYAEKEQALERQVARLKDVGATVAAERKSLFEAREKWDADRTAALESDRRSREELAAFRARASAEIEALRKQAPELEAQAAAAINRLASARDTLRGHLAELHDFARLSREDLATVRSQVQHEAERLRTQEETLNQARAEHRLSVTGFRQQLVEWQGQVAEMKRMLSSSESRLDAREAAVDQATRQAEATTQHLAEQAEELRREREAVSARRGEVERHLADMREWYRRKLRELAISRTAATGDDEPDAPRLARLDESDPPSAGPTLPSPALEELDPGDRQLGELLRSHGLVDGDTLAALWADAARQRRTLRQVLLASGVITLYQLAFIEAGNLDALMLGRFRVIDRMRGVTPREAIYRVFDPADRSRPDPARPGSPGVYLLRHLAESEMQDAVHPDEFRQRFAAARDAAHPNLAGVVEVLEIAGRPAVLQDWLTGLFSADWPVQASHPGCWVRLATMAASGIEAAHRHGLVHGCLTSDSFVLTAAGSLKVTGFGEPPWLASGPIPTESSPAADLRAFGQVAYGWAQLATKRKGGVKPRPFPDSLLGVIRRLEADPEPPMADTVAAERPYESAAELVADLNRIARETSFSDDAWDKLLRHVAETAPDAPAGLKRSA